MRERVELALTEQEFKEVVKEIVERVKDIVYMNLENKTKQSLQDILKGKINPDESIRITWEVEFIFNDIVQIVGRLRRKKGDV